MSKPDLFDLSGKVALITGASRGIGLAIAERCARDGANIVIAAKSDTEQAKLEGTIHSAAEAVEAAGGKALAVKCDIRDEAQVEAIRSTGASWLQMLNYAIQPQIMPRLIGLSLYRLDINFRESAVIGIVGAGGIGATLNTALDR